MGGIVYTWTYQYTFREVPSSGAAPYTASADVILTTGAADGQGAYTVLSASGTIDGAAITGLDTTHHEGNTLTLSGPFYGINSQVDGIGGVVVGFTLSDGRISLINYQSFLHNLYAAVDVPRISYPTAGVVDVSSFQTTACYTRGTAIMTTAGEIPVEDLRTGDTVLTADGAAEPIRWIGYRSYDGRFIAADHLMLPVTIRAGAISDGVPHTNLVVSPGHAMWVDGQLVPAWRLVNGLSITQAGAVDEVTYFHVELHRHALLLANGAPAESFLEQTGFRGQFRNAAEFHAAHPNAQPLAPMQARLEDGFALQCIQERLAARAGVRPAVEPAGALRGYVDEASPNRLCGWAQDVDSPEEPVVLEVLVNGVAILTVLANGYRADLRKAGFGSGCHAFDIRLPLNSTVMVRRVTDAAMLKMTAAAEQRLAA